jgi:phosphoglycolate phosphatase
VKATFVIEFRWPLYFTTFFMALIVFDLDGTLIDSRRDLAESTNEMLASYGATPLPLDQVAAMVGEGARVLVQRALAAAGLNAEEPDALQRFRDVYDRRLLLHTRPYDGIEGVVRELGMRHTLAVLTNKPAQPSERLLDAFGLAASFRRVIGGDSQLARKPDPSGLRALMHEFGSDPRHTWLIGDSMIDVETARRAGTRMCVALYGFGQLRGELVLDGSEATVRMPAEIPGVVQELRVDE